MATPISELIAANVLTTLQGITVLAGFERDMTAERRKRTLVDGNRPHNNLIIQYQDDPFRGDEEPQGRDAWVLPYIAMFYVFEPEASATLLDTIVNTVMADIVKALKVDVTRGALAVDTLITGFEVGPYTSSDGEEYEGGAVEFQVLYRHLENDPYTQ